MWNCETWNCETSKTPATNRQFASMALAWELFGKTVFKLKLLFIFVNASLESKATDASCYTLTTIIFPKKSRFSFQENHLNFKKKMILPNWNWTEFDSAKLNWKEFTTRNWILPNWTGFELQRGIWFRQIKTEWNYKAEFDSAE